VEKGKIKEKDKIHDMSEKKSEGKSSTAM